MATIKDIAKAAGVSPSTVSNVLNKRGNVSYKKILLVEQTARNMGYQPSEVASALRSGKVKEIAVTLPMMDSAAYADLYKGVMTVALEHGYAVKLYVTYNSPEREKHVIEEILSSRAEFAIVVTSLLDPAQRYEQLTHAGTQVMFVERVGEHPGFIGFDMREVAREIAERVHKDGALTVGLMTDMLNYKNVELFVNTFRDRLMQLNPLTKIQCIHTVPAQYAKRAFQFVQGTMPDAIVVTNEKMALAVSSALMCNSHDDQPRVYAIVPFRALPSPDYISYTLNYRYLGRVVAESLLSGDERKHPLILKANGFHRQADFPRIAKAVELSLLSIESPYTIALRQIAPFLKRDLGIELKIITFGAQELNQVVRHYGKNNLFDLIRVDMAALGELSMSTFAPLNTLDIDLADIRNRMLPGLWGEFTAVRGVDYTLPSDPSAMVLFFRRDLLEDSAMQRAYYERHKRRLAVPSTYEEWIDVSDFFDRHHRASSPTPFGTVLSNRDAEYVAHFAAAADKLDDLQNPIFLKTLEEHKRLLHSSMVLPNNPWWMALMEQFNQGQCALAMVYSNYAESLCDSPLSKTHGRIGHAIVPGCRPLLGGGAMGVSQASSNKDAAADMLSWLYSENANRMLALISGSSPCAFVYEDDQLLDIYPWLTTVRESLNCGIRRRLFSDADGADLSEFEHSIGFFARNAMDGIISPERALNDMNRAIKDFHSQM